MEVDGFKLPASYVEICQAIRERRSHPIWVHIYGVDAYGRPWEARDMTIQGDEESIKEDTEFLRQRFREGGFRQNEAARDEPGFATEISDVSKLIWFGSPASGEPFCFDFGASPKEPSVIFWASSSGVIYWRQVAPNFDDFIALFRPANEAEPYDASGGEWTEEEWDQALPPPRSLLDGMAAIYAQKTDEGRREMEMIVRSQLDSPGIDDEQRQKLEGLLARLRSIAGA
jgi:SMI1/KNR4 family protein SUKH-1